jgi:Rad3-related DNA helicase
MEGPTEPARGVVQMEAEEKKVAKPPILTIGGVKINNPAFPFKPYPSQLAFMSKVILTLNQSENALLESPTGSGKTLALLCSALSWQASMYERQARLHTSLTVKPGMGARDKEVISMNGGSVSSSKTPELPRAVPRIFFCSRTHSQISQILKELKGISDHISIATLGSREQLCINPTLKDSRQKNMDCRHLLETQSCNYRNKAESLLRKVKRELPVHDIEDLARMGKRIGGCSYYASRDMVKHADVVFAPYNYLVDPSVRASCNISLKGAVVIIDEAHNAEDIGRSSASLEYTFQQLQEIIFNDSNNSQLFRNILQWCNTEGREYVQHGKPTQFSHTELARCLEKFNITHDSLQALEAADNAAFAAASSSSSSSSSSSAATENDGSENFYGM